MNSWWRWIDFVPWFLRQGCGGTGTSRTVRSRDRPEPVGLKANEGDRGTKNNTPCWCNPEHQARTPKIYQSYC